jgi:2-hydroxychromene-2-carboxylate isomerase
MTKSIEFYFDFVSPYSYIAHKRIRKMDKEEYIKFIYKPILLGGLHNLIGITAPAFINPKAKFMIRDCKMVAKKFNINFTFNSKFPIISLNLMRGFLSIKSDKKKTYINNFFDAYWCEGLNLNEELVIFSVLKKCKINKDDFQKKIKDQKIKNKLKILTQEAYEKDIFGAPTFVVNNKIFWGQDRLDYALDEAKLVKLYKNENPKKSK